MPRALFTKRNATERRNRNTIISHGTQNGGCQILLIHVRPGTTPINSEVHPICGCCHSASLGTVAVVAAAGRAQPQVGRHFVMMRVGKAEDVAWSLGRIAGKRAGVDRIRLGGVGHQARTLVHLRGHRPAHVSAYQSRVPYLGGFVLVARQSRWLY